MAYILRVTSAIQVMSAILADTYPNEIEELTGSAVGHHFREQHDGKPDDIELYI